MGGPNPKPAACGNEIVGCGVCRCTPASKKQSAVCMAELVKNCVKHRGSAKLYLDPTARWASHVAPSPRTRRRIAGAISPRNFHGFCDSAPRIFSHSRHRGGHPRQHGPTCVGTFGGAPRLERCCSHAGKTQRSNGGTCRLPNWLPLCDRLRVHGPKTRRQAQQRRGPTAPAGDAAAACRYRRCFGCVGVTAGFAARVDVRDRRLGILRKVKKTGRRPSRL
jgi:hypothetical protein